MRFSIHVATDINQTDRSAMEKLKGFSGSWSKRYDGDAEPDNAWVEVETLEDLKAIQDAMGSNLIVDFGSSITGPNIWVYNGYVE